MSSYPPRPSWSRRRQNPPTEQPDSTSASAQSQPGQSSSQSQTNGSRESPSVLLNDTPAPDAQEQQQKKSSTSESPSATQASAEPRHCWICLSNETEDSPLTSAWRTPCPCALTAHESCLLDWIADLQAPNARRRTRTNSKILCPQCKSEIVVARPRSVIVDTVNGLERTLGKLFVPGIASFIVGCTYSGCMVYGIGSVVVIFGAQDARKILGRGMFITSQTSLISSSHPTAYAGYLNPFVAATLGWTWRLGVGLPLIPLVLILSRTTLADSVLPVLPIIFFATQSNERERLDFSHWPPSAAMSVAVLPYLRQAYNEFYERAFGEYERRWAREVQPRLGDAAQEGANPQAGQGNVDAEDDDEGAREEVVMELNLDIGVFDDEGNPEQNGEPNEQLHEDARPEQQGEGNERGQPAAAAGAAEAAAPPPQVQRANNWVVSTGRIVDSVVGALLFPTISGVMGELLKALLPKSWIFPSSGGRNRPTGLFQHKWGRSIVGGCLFVAMKDAVILYCRWKQAQAHRYRRVLDYDKRTKSVRDAGT
ncbi:MAG: hypothetical protein M1833_006424 [Piccolia ochrophora]|nr:MAG: hypothetical protein M1833_006424 [Piccolia ochrophora]